MKNIFLLLLLLFGITSAALAQRLRLNGYGSYVFDDGFESSYDANTFYNGTVNGGGQWGAGIEYLLHPNYCIEFLYLHQTTHVPINYKAGAPNPLRSETPKLKIDCFLLGSDAHYVLRGTQAELYGGLFLGEARLHSENEPTGERRAADKFSLAARAGCIVWAMGKIGIKLQAQFLSIVRGTGNDLYFGTYGNSVGLNDYSGIYQFGLGAGLTLKL